MWRIIRYANTCTVSQTIRGWFVGCQIFLRPFWYTQSIRNVQKTLVWNLDNLILSRIILNPLALRLRLIDSLFLMAGLVGFCLIFKIKKHLFWHIYCKRGNFAMHDNFWKYCEIWKFFLHIYMSHVKCHKTMFYNIYLGSIVETLNFR